VDRQLGELQLRLREAPNEGQFQAVGHLCRETLISVAQVVYQRERHPSLDGIEPSKTDAKRILEAFVSGELAGSENAAVRKVAKAAFDLSTCSINEPRYSGKPLSAPKQRFQQYES
jgi:hypothetical protein